MGINEFAALDNLFDFEKENRFTVHVVLNDLFKYRPVGSKRGKFTVCSGSLTIEQKVQQWLLVTDIVAARLLHTTANSA
jgi:hypothetical protein